MARMIEIIFPAIPETLYMVITSTLAALVIGFPIGVLLVLTREDGLHPLPGFYKPADWLVNILRSLPFVVLMLVLFPVSRLIVGKSIGSTAAIVPLSISAAPFVARLMEGYLLNVDRGVIEAAMAMGANNRQLVGLMITEAMPNIVSGITMTMINLVGYSAMAGLIGGGGLGDIAGRYGYAQNQTDILWGSVLVIILIVQVIQRLGSYISKRIDKK